MIEKYYELNGMTGRPLSPASVDILQIIKSPLIAGGTPTNFDLTSFLFVHFAEWAVVKKLAARVRSTSGAEEAWTEAVLDWSANAFAGQSALAVVEAGDLVARMVEDAFGKRVTVIEEGGEPGKEILQTGSLRSF
ncbi:MAG: hypothetical protein RLZZ244_1853 [Verrucomicrobiota bacterium]|jgi:hypothetical protein